MLLILCLYPSFLYFNLSVMFSPFFAFTVIIFTLWEDIFFNDELIFWPFSLGMENEDQKGCILRAAEVRESQEHRKGGKCTWALTYHHPRGRGKCSPSQEWWGQGGSPGGPVCHIHHICLKLPVPALASDNGSGHWFVFLLPWAEVNRHFHMDQSTEPVDKRRKLTLKRQFLSYKTCL